MPVRAWDSVHEQVLGQETSRPGHLSLSSERLDLDLAEFDDALVLHDAGREL